jgi:hypothetical protein
MFKEKAALTPYSRFILPLNSSKLEMRTLARVYRLSTPFRQSSCTNCVNTNPTQSPMQQIVYKIYKYDPTQSPNKSYKVYEYWHNPEPQQIVRVSVKSAWSPAPKRGHVSRARPPPAVENKYGRLALDVKEADGREVAHKQALIFTSPRESEEYCETKEHFLNGRCHRSP